MTIDEGYPDRRRKEKMESARRRQDVDDQVSLRRPDGRLEPTSESREEGNTPKRNVGLGGILSGSRSGSGGSRVGHGGQKGECGWW